MNYAIKLLESERKKIDRTIRNNNLMQQDMEKARAGLCKINELKRAIKILKQKNQVV